MMTQNSYTEACRVHLWFWALNLPLFIKRKTGDQVSSCFLEAVQVLQAMASDQEPKRTQILYDPLHCYPCEFCSWFVLGAHDCLAPTAGTNPLLCPELLQSHLMLLRPGDSAHETAMDITLQIVRSCWTKKGELISFSLHRFLCAEMGFGVSNTSLFRKSIYFISTEFSHANYTVWILQIQQCASKSRINTSYYCIQRAEGRGIKHRKQSWWRVSFLVAEDCWVGYLSFRCDWKNHVLFCTVTPWQQQILAVYHKLIFRLPSQGWL